jgi:hypothetical protein
VYLTYHDWGPSQIWVNASTDGGRTFGPPMDVIALSPLAQEGSFCDTVPGGIKVVQSGPHAGRVYVAWIAGDVVTNIATACNVTQMQTFHTVWMAWSDNADTQVPTWTTQLVFDGGIGADASGLFADIALDNQGNPYLAFSINLAGEFDTFVMASFDNGATWNGKSDGTGVPYRVNQDSGTHFFPAIAVGDPGMVDVAFLRTETVVPTLPYGKPKAGGDPNALWKAYMAQSLDLRLGSPTWTVTDLSPDYMHKGDICTLGIFCISTLGSDRSLLDFIDIAIDSTGMGHVGYTDNYNKTKITLVANQIAGPPAKARG